MKYRVSIERVLPDPMIRNPFVVFRRAEDFEGAKCKVLVRTWEFEARNEREVRRLFEKAKIDDLPQVRGFKIRSIEQLEQNEQ